MKHFDGSRIHVVYLRAANDIENPVGICGEILIQLLFRGNWEVSKGSYYIGEVLFPYGHFRVLKHGLIVSLTQPQLFIFLCKPL